MTEKLLIITEKPSAAKNFTKALGGASGTFNNNEYSIVNLYGHIIGNPAPDETALPQYKQTVGKFSQLGGIPWNYTWFDFNKKVASKQMADTTSRVMQNINGHLKNGYIPVIATDNDESGEGDLLAREVLVALQYNGKTYREYHVDESQKEITKALSNLKEVSATDPTYVMAFTRSNMDYLTQQLTRVATMTIQAKGYKLPSPVPMGRLKSVMLTIIGNQLNAINAYKPTSVFESRYKLGSLILANKDVPQFQTKEEWNAGELPLTSHVKETKQVRGETIPPKALTLSQLAGLMAKKGLKSKAFLDTYQKMYEAGVMSYPRTEDNFISPEQFNEMLPLVDTILGLLNLPTAAFTHRTPRSTHVKTGGSHGALRPGLTIPNSLSELDNKFGAHASDIYQAAAERFLMMFLENTEWIKHLYVTTDTKEPFTGTIKIITKQGVVDPDEKDDTVATSLPDTSQLADLYPHEVKSKKPHAVTSGWLASQMAKVNVGTGATRISTLAAMSGNSPQYPIKENKTLDLSTMGWVGYQAAQGTKIGSVEGTQYLTNLVKEVRDGKDIPTAYQEFTNVIKHDTDILKNISVDFSNLDIPTASPKKVAKGEWHGKHVEFNRIFMGYEYSDAELETLLNGGEIEFTGTTKEGKSTKVKGHLEDLEYKGAKFVGLKGEFIREGYVTRPFNGQNITIKGSYMDHQFTPEELDTLFSGQSVAITTHKNEQTYNLTGKIEKQSYKGKTFYGYKAVFPVKEGYVKGTWNGQEVTFKGSYMDHIFSQDEIDLLLKGQSVAITTHKNDKAFELTGKLETQDYKGHKFVGYKAVFPQDNSDRITGTWLNRQVSFKKMFMTHTFTTGEVKELLAGNKITFQGTTKKGSALTVTGGLAEQNYQGRKFVGFKADFDNKADKGL